MSSEASTAGHMPEVGLLRTFYFQVFPSPSSPQNIATSYESLHWAQRARSALLSSASPFPSPARAREATREGDAEVTLSVAKAVGHRLWSAGPPSGGGVFRAFASPEGEKDGLSLERVPARPLEDRSRRSSSRECAAKRSGERLSDRRDWTARHRPDPLRPGRPDDFDLADYLHANARAAILRRLSKHTSP